MRVLFAVMPGDGHLNPVLPLAHALCERHEVVFGASRLLKPAIEAHGFESVSAGRDWLLRDLGEHFPVPRDLTGDARLDAVYRHAFIGGAALELAPDLLRVITERRVDLVVADAPNFAAGVAAEAAGIPHVEVAVASLSGARGWVARYLPELTVLRASVGLAPDPGLEQAWRHALLSSVPRLFYGDADLPPTFTAVRMDDFAEAPAPEWITELPPRPTVYATLGTVQNWRAETFTAIIEGLGGEDLNAVLTTGGDVEGLQLGTLAPNVRVERFVPQMSILPHCSAVVCHGGSGTVRGAAWCGLPMVLIPFSADQPTNARLLTELGAAVTVTPESADPLQIRAAVRTVLSEPSFGERARWIAQQMWQLPGIERAVEIVEEVGRSREA